MEPHQPGQPVLSRREVKGKEKATRNASGAGQEQQD